MMFRPYRPVFSDRLARTLFTSAAISGLGDWIGLAGLVVLAYQRSGSAVGSAALFAVQGVAAVGATTLIGPRLDHLNRSRALSVAYTVGGLSLLIPTVLGGLWPVLLSAAIVGLVRPITAALRHAVAGAELDGELLGPVVALQKATGDAAAAVGLATGGALTILLGANLSLGLDALTFLVAAAQTFRLPISRGSAAERGTGFDGFRIWLRDPPLRMAVGVIVALAAVSSLPETLAPAVAGDSIWLSAVLASQAAGTAMGGILVGHRRHLETPRVLIGGMLAVAVTLGIGGAAALGHPAFLALANFLLGLALSVAVLAQTAFTRGAPPERLGAAVSSAITAVMLTEGLGALAVGILADRLGVSWAYVAAGVGLVAAAGLLISSASQGTIASRTASGTPASVALAGAPWPPPSAAAVDMAPAARNGRWAPPAADTAASRIQRSTVSDLSSSAGTLRSRRDSR